MRVLIGICAVAVVATTFFGFSPVLQNEFTSYDDLGVIVDNQVAKPQAL